MNVPKTPPNCSTSFALSLSEMLLISAAYADVFVRQDPLIPPSDDRMPCFEPSVLLSVALLSAVRLLLFCAIPGTAIPQLI